MTSERKILANRQNAKRSTGPRTATGKSRASRNAVRHGLESVNFGDTGYSAQVERLAKAICPDASDPFRYEQAVIIAESQILAARVRAARLAAIERIRKSTVRRLPILPGFPAPEECEGIVSAFERGDLRNVTKILNQASKALNGASKPLRDQMKKLPAKRTAKAEQHRVNVAREANHVVEMLREGTDKSSPEAPDEIECLRRALPELLSLERYERRALSRRRRAIRRFDALASLTRHQAQALFGRGPVSFVARQPEPNTTNSR